MKNANGSKPQKAAGNNNDVNNNHVNRPEIRDNLDSRANEEQEFKGDDETNNKKDTKSSKLKKK